MQSYVKVKTVRRGAKLMCGVVASAMLLFGVSSVSANVLDDMPSNSTVVMRLKNINEANIKVGAFLKQLGVVEMKPELADPLAVLMAEGKVKEGLDKSGDFGLYMMIENLEKMDDAKPPLVLLVPVTDYKAFIGNFGESKRDGNVDVILGDSDMFITQWDKYAAMSPIKAMLEKKPDGFKTSAKITAEFEAKDMTMMLNMKTFGPMAKEKIAAHKDELKQTMNREIEGNDKVAKYSKLINIAVDQGIKLAESVVSQTDVLAFSANLGEKGITGSYLAEFKPDSTAGAIFAKMSNIAGPIVLGLPEAKYVLAGGGINGHTMDAELIDFLKPIEEEMARSGDEMKPALTMINAMKKLTKAQDTQATGIIAPVGAFGQTSMFQMVTVFTGNAKDFIAAQGEMMTGQQELMALLPNQPKTTLKITPDAKTIDGVSFTKLATEFDGDDAASMQAKQVIAMVYGPNGATAYIGAIDDKHALLAYGLDDAMISATIKSVKAGDDQFSKMEGFKLVNGHLPANRMSVGYFDLGLVVTTVTNYAKMMMLTIPVNIKPDLPPIGMAVSTDGSLLRADVFIPGELTEAMAATVIQLRMMGAGKPGKAGGL